jgi:mRNA-degrading endonuclease toxin of MazEF toxin-antitoxin module
MPVRQGEVYYAFRDKRRPVIIMSREELNRGQYVLAVPLTTKGMEFRRRRPNCVPLSARRDGVPKDCVAQGELVTVLDLVDLDLDRGPITSLREEALRALIRAVGYVLDAECEPT